MWALYGFLYCLHEGSNIGMQFYMTTVARQSLLAALYYTCIHTPTKFPTVYWRDCESSASCCAFFRMIICAECTCHRKFSVNQAPVYKYMKSFWAACSILDSKRKSRRHVSCVHVRQLQPYDSATQIMKKDWMLLFLTFLGAWQRSRHHIHSVYWMKSVSTGWICEHVWCVMSVTRIFGPIFSENIPSHQLVLYIVTPLWNSCCVYENLLLSFQHDCIISHHRQFCLFSNVLVIYCVLNI